MLLQLQDCGTSLWQLHFYVTSSPGRLKVRLAAIGPDLPFAARKGTTAFGGTADNICSNRGFLILTRNGRPERSPSPRRQQAMVGLAAMT
jgi:hypothetical protein